MTAPVSICERVIAVITTRLAAVNGAGNYNTAAGAKVFDSVRSLNESDLPCFVIFEGGETTNEGSGNNTSMLVTIPIDIECHVAADQADTGKALRKIKADGKRALMLGVGHVKDATGKLGILEYKGSNVNPRADGSSSESVTLQFVASYKEGYGDPASNTA